MIDRKYFLLEKLPDSEEWQYSSSKYGTDFLLEQIKNGTNIEIRHSLLDSVIVSENLEAQIEKATQIQNTTNNKEKVKLWNDDDDFSKVELTKLYNAKLILKAFKGTTLLKKIDEDYKKKKENEKFYANIVKDILPFISIFSFVFSAYDFLQKGVSSDLSLRPLILLIISVVTLISFVIIFKNNRKKKCEYYLKEIEKTLPDLSDKDIAKILEILKPQECSLNKHCINLIVNAHNSPFIKLEILRSFISFKIGKQGDSKSKNMANIVFSLNDIGVSLPFHNSNIPICKLELIPLTYEEKLKIFEDTDKKYKGQKYDYNTTLLKFLGIDIIKEVVEISNLEKIKEDSTLCKKFNEDLDKLVRNTNQSKDCILILLYFYTYLANINGRFFTKEELHKLLIDSNDSDINNLCNVIKSELSIPANLNSEQAENLVDSIFKYFNKIYHREKGSYNYRFNDYLETVLYLCASDIIDKHITQITKLCILNIHKLHLTVEDICSFAKKACYFLIDKIDDVNYEFYRILLEETEKKGLIYFHYVIFEIINNHINISKTLRQKIAKSPDIIRSAFMSLVHYPDEEVLEQNTTFIKHCASEYKSIRIQTKKCPPYMDIIILESRARNEYYTNLKLIEEDEEKNDTLKFIKSLYSLYCTSLKNSRIIDDSFFFINKSLIDADKTKILKNFKYLCKNKYKIEFKDSQFDIFIEDIKSMFDNKLEELPDYDREIYSFLIKLYYYANNSIFEENFVRFVDLIVESKNLGIVTKCELMSEFGYYVNYQNRRINEFLTWNAGKLKEIIETRVQEKRFTIKLAYKSISNINSVNDLINSNSEHIDLRNYFVELIKEKFPDKFNQFEKDVKVLMYHNIPDNLDIRDLIDRMSLIDANLVVLILSDFFKQNEVLAVNLIRKYFESLKNSTLTTTTDILLNYLNNNHTVANQNDIDILNYLVDSIGNIAYKHQLEKMRYALDKWQLLLGKKYKDTHIKTIEREYELRTLKLKTDAIENNDENLEEDIETLEIEKDKKIEAFNNRETTREAYSKKSVRRRQNG